MLAAILVPSGVASADSLLVSSVGARNLASGHGYLAWVRPTERGRWRLVVRSPDGTVRTPSLRSFGAAADPTIGRYGGRLVVAYARCAGASAVRGCDVYAYDLRGRRERRVPGLGTHAYSETAPDLDHSGAWSFVRRGGARPGVYLRTGEQSRRLTARLARETALSRAYVVIVDPTPYMANGCCTVVRALARRGGGMVSFGSPMGSVPHALTVAGERAFWLDEPKRANGSIPLDPRGRGHRDVTTPAARELPATTQSIAATAGAIDVYLDGEGVMRVDPALYPPFP